MFKEFAEDTDLDQLPDTARRAFSVGLGLFPLLPLLPGCGASVEDSPRSAQDRGQTQEQPSSPAATASGPAQTPTSTPASVSGVFRHPGLLVTEDDFTRIRTHVEAGQQPWTDWWNKLCADALASLDAKPNPQAAVYRADGTKWAMYRDIQRAWCLARTSAEHCRKTKCRTRPLRIRTRLRCRRLPGRSSSSIAICGMAEP